MRRTCCSVPRTEKQVLRFAQDDKTWLNTRLIELLSQSLPALEVLVIELRGLQSKPGRLAHEASLEHEGQRVLDVNGLQIGLAGLLECLGIGSMTSHAIVQARAAGHESLSLRVVLSMDQSHELIHEIAMKPRWTKGVLGNHPARREDYEVKIGGARNFRGRSKHRIDRRIRMIETHGIDAVEICQIVLIGDVVPVPCNHVQRRVIDGCSPESSLKLGHDAKVALAIFKRGDGCQKIARVRQSICPNRPQVRQAKERTIVLADVTSRFLVEQLNTEADSALNHGDLAGTGLENPHLCTQQQTPGLGYDQHLTIGVVEKAIRHRGVRDVDVNPDAGMSMRVAIARHGDEAVDEVGSL